MNPATVIPDRKRTLSRKMIALGVAVLVHVFLGIIAVLIVFLPPLLQEPEIVAEIIGGPAQAKQSMQKKNVAQQISHADASAAAPLANMIRATAAAQFAAPEIKTTSTAVGLGEGDLGSFGGNLGGLGSGASFFGAGGRGNRVIFVLDFSASMQARQMDLVVREMERSLKGLRPDTQYQVILFAGGAKFAEPGWSIQERDKFDKFVVDPKGRKFRFYSPQHKHGNYAFDGSDSGLPAAGWLAATQDNLKRTLRILEEKRKWLGTDWRWAFKTAMNMEPPPQVIFFMADGTGGAFPSTIIDYNNKHGKAQINTYAMDTTEGAEEFREIAKATGGSFTIVLPSGDTIKGDDYFKAPAKYARQIGGR